MPPAVAACPTASCKVTSELGVSDGDRGLSALVPMVPVCLGVH